MTMLMQVGASATCPHGGQVSIVPGQSRVLLGGQPAATLGDTFTVAGCAFNISGAPHPCTSITWVAPATRVLIGGQPAILQTSTGLAVAANQLPQGAPIVASTQTGVSGQ